MTNISYMSTGFAVYLACYMQSTSCMYIICTLAHTVRIVEFAEGVADLNADFTDQIRQFSEIGPSGSGTTPCPWVCYIQGSATGVHWQTPNGNAVPPIPPGFTQAMGSQLYQAVAGGDLALIRGPDYNSPHGEYCCVKLRHLLKGDVSH